MTETCEMSHREFGSVAVIARHKPGRKVGRVSVDKYKGHTLCSGGEIQLMISLIVGMPA